MLNAFDAHLFIYEQFKLSLVQAGAVFATLAFVCIKNQVLWKTCLNFQEFNSELSLDFHWHGNRLEWTIDFAD